VQARLTWLLVVAPSLLGVVAGHAIYERLLGRTQSPGELLASERGAGLGLVAAVAAVAIVVGLCARARRTTAGLASFEPSRLQVAVLPLVVFALQEHVESGLAGRPWWNTTASASFSAGLALQLPFAALAYALGGALRRAADALARLGPRPRVVTTRRPSQPRPRQAPPVRLPAFTLPCKRGPPIAVW
jgi:hypothetical protein